MAKATLFGVPASHPTYAAELMLRQKGVDYRRVDLVAVVHRGVLRVLGFPGITATRSTRRKSTPFCRSISSAA